jgi:hypothetical protein
MGKPNDSTQAAEPADVSAEPTFKELTGDYFPQEAQPATAQPSTEAQPQEPAKDGAEQPAAPTEQPTPQPSVAEPAKPTAQEPVKFKYRDKEYTQADLARDPELFNTVMTAAEQYRHLNPKYQELLEKVAQQGAQPVQQPGQPQVVQPPATVPTPEQIRVAYEPQVKQAVQDGIIEENFANEYPTVSSQFMYLAELLFDQRAATAAIINQMSAGRQQTQVQQDVQIVTGLIENLAARPEPQYAALKDNATKKKVFDRIVQLQPDRNLVNEDFVKQLYLGMVGETLLQGAAQAAEQAKQAEELRRRQATSEGGGARPGPVIPATGGAPWNDIVEQQFRS